MNISLEEIIEELSPFHFIILKVLESDNQSSIEGKTKFQKIMFLIGNIMENIGKQAQFESYLFGPHSKELENGLSDLISYNLIEEKNNLTLEIISMNATLNILKGQKTTLNTQNANLLEEKDTLLSQIESLENNVNTLQNSLDSCEGDLNDCESSCP